MKAELKGREVIVTLEPGDTINVPNHTTTLVLTTQKAYDLECELEGIYQQIRSGILGDEPTDL